MASMEMTCHACGTVLEVQSEWAGMQVSCPQCNTTLTVPAMAPQQPMNGYQQPMNGYQQPVNGYQQPSAAAKVLGIISVVAWLFPIIGLPTSIVALVFGITKKYNPGIIMSVIGLVLSLINAILGAILASM